MSSIEVRAGIVADVSDNGAGITFNLGTPPMVLSIGAVPTRMPPGTLIPNAVDPGEYIAVAICKSILQPLNYVLLAYRRPRGEIHAANFKTAAFAAAAGTVGLSACLLAATPAEGIAGISASLVVLVPAVLRLLAVRKATSLLKQCREPE